MLKTCFFYKVSPLSMTILRIFFNRSLAKIYYRGCSYYSICNRWTW